MTVLVRLRRTFRRNETFDWREELRHARLLHDCGDAAQLDDAGQLVYPPSSELAEVRIDGKVLACTSCGSGIFLGNTAEEIREPFCQLLRGEESDGVRGVIHHPDPKFQERLQRAGGPWDFLVLVALPR